MALAYTMEHNQTYVAIKIVDVYLVKLNYGTDYAWFISSTISTNTSMHSHSNTNLHYKINVQ